MSEEQVSAVYARALFGAAQDVGVVAEVRRDLGDFVAAVAASASLRDVLADPQVDMAAKRRVLAELAREGQPLVANTLQLLLERGRLAALEGVQEQYEILAAAQSEQVRVDVTSAIELSTASRERIIAHIEKLTGRKTQIRNCVDAALLGGLVLRVGDVVVDGSVRARIEQLRRRLATAHVRGDVE